MENELTRWKGASLHKWWGSILHHLTSHGFFYFFFPWRWSAAWQLAGPWGRRVRQARDS